VINLTTEALFIFLNLNCIQVHIAKDTDRPLSQHTNKHTSRISRKYVTIQNKAVCLDVKEFILT
jgi:hypothetical protein